jgi:hypothetical protein
MALWTHLVSLLLGVAGVMAATAGLFFLLTRHIDKTMRSSHD